MSVTSHFAAILSLCAAGSLAATDVAAAELPMTGSSIAVATPGVFDAQAMEANGHRWYRHRRHRGVDAGDVLAGVLIIGGIAAIANAAARNNRERDYRYRDRDYRYRDRDERYRDRRYYDRYDGSRGIDRAVDMCVREVERDARVDRVDSVERDGSGWEVEGRLYNGDVFACRIGADGRIEDLDIDGRDFAFAPDAEASDDRQWDDARYAQARARLDRAPQSASAQPAYPGGPVSGDDVTADYDTSAPVDGADDGRYDTHTAPDFDDA